MTAQLEYRVAELERRMLGMIRVGIVKELIADRVTVKAGDLVTGPLPWVTRRAGNDRDWWAPEPGEQVLLVCPCGDPALGVVIPAIYRDDFPAPGNGATVHRTVYKDGAVIEYDRVAHKLKANIPGVIEATALEIKLTGSVKIIGQFQVTGKITSDTAIEAKSIKADGTEVSHHNHTCPHGGTTSNL